MKINKQKKILIIYNLKDHKIVQTIKQMKPLLTKGAMK